MLEYFETCVLKLSSSLSPPPSSSLLPLLLSPLSFPSHLPLPLPHSSFLFSFSPLFPSYLLFTSSLPSFLPSHLSPPQVNTLLQLMLVGLSLGAPVVGMTGHPTLQALW